MTKEQLSRVFTELYPDLATFFLMPDRGQKIMVPEACVQVDEYGKVILAMFHTQLRRITENEIECIKYPRGSTFKVEQIKHLIPG